MYFITGVFCHAELLTVTEDAFHEVFDTNVRSVLNVSQVVAREMIKQGLQGAIVNISSISSARAWTSTLLLN